MLDNYYRPWHLNLELNIEQQLARWGHCLLLDCHSFPEEPFGHERNNGMPRPDICLGFNYHNTPQWLVDSCMEQFKRHGYSVSIDTPYSGCLVPDSYLGDARVPAIMLEINRRLYLKPHSRGAYHSGDVPVRLSRFDRIKNDVWSIMLLLAKEARCRIST